MPTFRHTPFILGRECSVIAGEMGRRAGCGFRGERRTWFSVVRYAVEVEKGAARGVRWRRLEADGVTRGKRTLRLGRLCVNVEERVRVRRA
jgi:hypothetical protein